MQEQTIHRDKEGRKGMFREKTKGDSDRKCNNRRREQGCDSVYDKYKDRRCGSYSGTDLGA